MPLEKIILRIPCFRMKERKYGKERKRWEMWEENLLLDIVHGKLEGTQDIKSVLINDSKIWTRE